MKRKAKRIVPNIPKLSLNEVKIAVRNDDGLGTSIPPSLSNIEIYFDQKGLREMARTFYDEQELRRWTNPTGQPVTNWKVCATEWIYNYWQDMKRRLRHSPFYSESF